MLRLIIFGVVSAGSLFLSWGSLRDFRSHGFFRFFAFESILGLFLLNVTYWFRDPFVLRLLEGLTLRNYQ